MSRSLIWDGIGPRKIAIGPEKLIRLLILLERFYSLEQRWVTVVPSRIEPVIDREAEVVNVELDEGGLQRLRPAQTSGKLVSLDTIMSVKHFR